MNFDPLRYHGDDAARGARVDFAVNVRSVQPPQALRKVLSKELDTLGEYPSTKRLEEVTAAVAQWLGVPAEWVLLTSGASEAFSLLPKVFSGTATMIHPGFCEPEATFRAQGMPVERVILSAAEPASSRFALPEIHGELVMIGNPTNPTGMIYSREELKAIDCTQLVVDEAFLDITGLDSTHSLVGDPDVMVIRSLTKSWALAGLRCGIMVSNPDVIARCAALRPHWPLSSLQLAAFEWVSQAAPNAATAQATLAVQRHYQCEQLQAKGFEIVSATAAPYMLVRHPRAEEFRTLAAKRGIAVRRCDTFPGLDATYWRLAIRDRASVDELVRSLP